VAQQISQCGTFSNDTTAYLIVSYQDVNFGPAHEARHDACRKLLLAWPVQYIRSSCGQQPPFHLDAQAGIRCQQRNHPCAIRQSTDLAQAARCKRLHDHNTERRLV